MLGLYKTTYYFINLDISILFLYYTELKKA